MATFPRFLSVIIATIIVFQSVIVAPAINVALEVEPAAIMLRFIWPIFFALIGILGLVGVVTARKQKMGLIVNAATVVGMVVCYVLVPIINEAKDSDHMRLWSALHMVTVGLTFGLLVLHLVYVFRWGRPEKVGAEDKNHDYEL
ncbi:MAG: hypothetical protein AAF236_05730 [Verrucomicrobiota bacterium]